MTLIELVDISKELKREWDLALGEKKTRASLFNLVLYIDHPQYASTYRNLVSSVVSKFPCRVIFIVHDQVSAEASLKSTVSTETIGSGANQIFCEIITITASGPLYDRIYSLLLPHLLCDLPIYLLWTLDPAIKHPLLTRFEKIATRMIFDSQEMSDLKCYAESILSLQQRFHCELGDLHWSALAGWRSILSSYFDSPTSYQSLIKSQKIEICYALQPNCTNNHQEIQAAYLQAWLSCALDWQNLSFDRIDATIRLSYEASEGKSVVILKGKESTTLPSGAILSIEIENQEEECVIAFSRFRETRQVFTHYSDKERCDLPHFSYLPGVEEGKEILNEIFYPAHKKQYQKMLQTLATIPWTR